ncbi:DUF4267 domain-containing protein [Kribbella sp.]|uniref:DUF4267 domain-containing protein n=1 Tax=Kribbella sp. TaxID=1871183 RepID=UPI002D25EE98|nr:DUF4267 domain-containing protein [Kribbella sp.]HZX01345.1 DUF4267 domain-containing protein [Kribbella sp.]
MRRFTTVLTVLLGVFPLTFGTQFLVAGHTAAPSFGIAEWPTGIAAGYFAVKGIRDIVLGLNLLTLFALRQRRATGILMAISALIPITDMITVFTHGGPAATALGVHGLTALVMLFDAFLLIRERQPAEVLEPVHS